MVWNSTDYRRLQGSWKGANPNDLFRQPSGPTSEKRQKILELNHCLHDWCDAEGFGFVGHWATFQREKGQYKQDNLHLTDMGANLLRWRLAAGARKEMGAVEADAVQTNSVCQEEIESVCQRP